MNRTELEAYITETYSVSGEQLWMSTPTNTVFRHSRNQKWFAVILDIPREKLGLSGGGTLSVVNVKCDPRLIGSFREEPGIFPAYHMNKAHWLTLALDGSVEDGKLKFLLDMSYALTK
ncbi:MAG: MmcQ/YjbR family DNA-binding protein [Eubacteriales bacterium]|nr:MmcQ/YjbR family DNA-binding protein [Eubacteriales bacterium]